MFDWSLQKVEGLYNKYNPFGNDGGICQICGVGQPHLMNVRNELGMDKVKEDDNCPTEDFQNDRNKHLHVPEVWWMTSFTFSTIIQMHALWIPSTEQIYEYERQLQGSIPTSVMSVWMLLSHSLSLK